jgi:O-antigen/teichoic acid export membrane protein
VNWTIVSASLTQKDARTTSFARRPSLRFSYYNSDVSYFPIRMTNPIVPSSQKLGTRATLGAGLLIISRLITRSVDLVTLVILGRLLSPADFGLVAIAMSVVMIAEAIMELPVGLALVAMPQRLNEHYDTAFTLQLMRSGALVTILIVVAIPLSVIYSDQRLAWLLCALSIAPAMRGLGSPLIVEYALKLDYRPHLVLEISGKFAALLVSVTVAWCTGSYWAIAAGTIANPVVVVVLSYFVAPYLPTLTVSKWRDFSSYLGWTTATQAIASFNWQMDQLLLGKFISRLELGQFSMASNLSFMPTQIIVNQVSGPLVVAFSSVRHDTERLRAAYQKSAITIVSAALPLLVGMSMLSAPMIKVAFGQRWLEAAPILQWLSIALVPSLLVGPLTPLIISLNKAKIFARLALIEGCFKFPVMVLGAYYWGVNGVISVRLATGLFVSICSMMAVRELIGMSVLSQLLAPWRSVASASLMALVIRSSGKWLTTLYTFSNMALGLGAVVIAGAVTYIGSMFLLWAVAGYPEGIESKVAVLITGSWNKLTRLRSTLES